MLPIARPISIGFLMAVVGLVAADFAIVRGLWVEPNFWLPVAIATLPTINLLILAAPGLRRDHPGRPYWLGFEIGGGLTVLVVGVLAVSPTEVLWLPFAPINPWLRSLGPPFTTWVGITLIVVFYTPAQLVLAVLAGKFSARYRVVLERR